jgi:flagellar hook-length control protein FliK
MNPITRDLLQDGLPRLREMLQQSGMDVASLNIGSGGSSKNGGQPTPQAMDDRAGGPSGSKDTLATAAAQAKPGVGADGWDIWV